MERKLEKKNLFRETTFRVKTVKDLPKTDKTVIHKMFHTYL